MKLSTAPANLPDVSRTTNENKAYAWYFAAISAVYLIIAAGLAVRVKWGVMDEDFHLESSKPFAQFGINYTTLYNHVPPTGVSSHFWFAFWLWLFPGIDYIGLRLITCAGLALLVGLIYFYLRTISVDSQRKILGASLFMLAFPYFFLSVSTVMTEGPSYIFLFASLLILAVSRLRQLPLFFLACVLLGCTTVSRFYFIPLLPALFVVLFVADWEQYNQQGAVNELGRKLLRYLFIAVGILPLVGLAIIWGGLTPPAFHQWSKLRSGISFNTFRPLSTFILIGIYVAPIVLVNVYWKAKGLLRSVGIGVAVALILALVNVNLFHDSSSVNDVTSGPVEHTLAWLISRGELAYRAGLFMFYSLSFISMAVIIPWIVDFVKAKDYSDKALVYSIAFVVLFVISQAFVGGNHPFFERYLTHPWPFLGYILVCMFPRFLTTRTYLALGVFTVFSVFMLIKWGVQ
ncbi:hypothetical protein [Spirosoma pollinicola]|uniref:Glycosyltransferase RgtA/B/C/D-like domain-containing protein n=1 Tax=Spirosoma pollinicola TaxID=2057025 RepID=A0A2K8Z3B0_9BACT|nr:hypothetical protein [Spirosoma pollinicola]AUD04360.1 hypothetical protein CWM47_22455 [Spirosoma pollinicola]